VSVSGSLTSQAKGEAGVLKAINEINADGGKILGR